MTLNLESNVTLILKPTVTLSHCDLEPQTHCDLESYLDLEPDPRDLPHGRALVSEPFDTHYHHAQNFSSLDNILTTVISETCTQLVQTPTGTPPPAERQWGGVGAWGRGDGGGAGTAGRGRGRGMAWVGQGQGTVGAGGWDQEGGRVRWRGHGDRGGVGTTGAGNLRDCRGWGQERGRVGVWGLEGGIPGAGGWDQWDGRV